MLILEGYAVIFFVYISSVTFRLDFSILEGHAVIFFVYISSVTFRMDFSILGVVV